MKTIRSKGFWSLPVIVTILASCGGNSKTLSGQDSVVDSTKTAKKTLEESAKLFEKLSHDLPFGSEAPEDVYEFLLNVIPEDSLTNPNGGRDIYDIGLTVEDSIVIDVSIYHYKLNAQNEVIASIRGNMSMERAFLNKSIHFNFIENISKGNYDFYIDSKKLKDLYLHQE